MTAESITAIKNAEQIIGTHSSMSKASGGYWTASFHIEDCGETLREHGKRRRFKVAMSIDGEQSFDFEAYKTITERLDGWTVGFKALKQDIPDALFDMEKGQQAAIVVVEINDMNEPVHRPPDERAKAVQMAAILCGDPSFQKYMKAANIEDCAQILRDRLGIGSRREIATNDNAFHAWRDLYGTFDLERKYGGQ